ncbi:MAG TPA: polysaccharide deacetylase family protein [Solirubrobacteraceae bacterium]|nr:polysaccharide deacetylase family protein [Solirubrobacteraceae bacterium]
MSFEGIEARRAARAQERERRRRMRRRRITAIGALLVALVVVGAVALASSSNGGGSPQPKVAAHRSSAGRAHTHPVSHGSTVTGTPTGRPGTASVPVLMYHVIAPPPAGAPYPGLYVDPDQFAAQMEGLKAAGWHPVTLDQLRAYWTRGVPLPPGKPIVLTFDNGYRSQYTNALPVLERLHWVADENIQLTGLPPSQGGLTEAQVRGLLAAGWELDTQGISHADLITLSPSELRYQVATARQILRRRYGVPVNWFCYPSGHYDSTVIAAVRSAGYVGSTTVVPGWASRSDDPYRLPRLRVLGGTSPSQLLAQIAAAQSASPPPPSYS